MVYAPRLANECPYPALADSPCSDEYMGWIKGLIVPHGLGVTRPENPMAMLAHQSIIKERTIWSASHP